MSGDIYAVSGHGFRAVSPDMPLLPGEARQAPSLSEELLALIEVDQARIRRGAMLRSTDWTQGEDCQLSPEAKLAWAAYRQLLRDLPEKAGFPNCPWPSPPAGLDGSASVTLPVADPT